MIVFKGTMNDGTKVEAFVEELNEFLLSPPEQSLYLYEVREDGDVNAIRVQKGHVNWEGVEKERGHWERVKEDV
jgi:hypothetical protein